jgi:hypothetical protein
MITLQIILIVSTVIITLVLCSFFEWFVHAKVMHVWGKFSHIEHHDDHRPPKYTITGSDGDAHMPIWTMFVIVGLMAVIWMPYVWFTHWYVMWIVIPLSASYFFIYQYIHTCIHFDKGQWFRRTSMFSRIRSYHFFHHSDESDFPVQCNMCIVLTMWDKWMGTMRMDTAGLPGKNFIWIGKVSQVQPELPIITPPTPP